MTRRWLDPVTLSGTRVVLEPLAEAHVAGLARACDDGELCNHTVSPGGIYRDTVVFSIINQEWPAVRQNLRYLLERGGG